MNTQGRHSRETPQRNGITRREFIRKAAYAAPVITTLVFPHYSEAQICPPVIVCIGRCGSPCKDQCPTRCVNQCPSRCLIICKNQCKDQCPQLCINQCTIRCIPR